jgi:hypothetical protein
LQEAPIRYLTGFLFSKNKEEEKTGAFSYMLQHLKNRNITCHLIRSDNNRVCTRSSTSDVPSRLRQGTIIKLHSLFRKQSFFLLSLWKDRRCSYSSTVPVAIRACTVVRREAADENNNYQHQLHSNSNNNNNNKCVDDPDFAKNTTLTNNNNVH